MCHIHTKSIDKLALKKSGIPGGGTGLFTLKEINPGDDVCVYEGEEMKASEFAKTDSDYGAALNKSTTIDASSTQSTIGRYINHCRDENKKEKHCDGNNTKWVIDHRSRTIKVRATKVIPKNKEVFISYGQTYWKQKPKKRKKRPESNVVRNTAIKRRR